MTLYMDVHRNVHASVEAIAQAHLSDLEAQDRYGVKYIKYWVDPNAGTICCLVEGPSKDACVAVHREAHGLLADQIIEVETGIVEAFLGGQSQTQLGCALYRDGSLDSAYRIILFTDLTGSTEMTQRLGDAEAMRVLRAHDAVLDAALSTTGGRKVKHTGDGIMASFVSAANALRCAAEIQSGVARYNAANPERLLSVRIGMSAGEPVMENHDLFGATVQLARRVCDAAGPGQVVVTNALRELCAGKGFLFEDLGSVELKGFAERMRLHRLVNAAPPAQRGDAPA
ncbi:MAG: nickel-binding protein [Gemmatimonadota bacterium]